ncbi:TM1802 family CRISPR-associated protein [Desulfolucanica intricata]|uniref:TM1802 family CRISPR-associated protein n=1 Tax=Desulfolucanica intricata TaxID=1285191 RepID=UPI00083223BC|nr:TM1802 family CRISPR-associated protein [Desulfolucanica intricata]
MNLPQLTSFIGESVKTENHNLFSSLIKRVGKVKETETAYIISLIFDLKAGKIDFCLDKPFSEDSVNEYYYFGNNSAASSQYYLVRETKSLNYLLSSIWNDLNLTLGKYNLQDGELATILKKMEACNLITLGSKKGLGKVNLKKLSILKAIKTVELDQKELKVDGRKYNYEAFIRLFLSDDNKKNRYVLIVPVVRTESGEEIILSTHPEYLELVKQANNLGEGSQDEKKAAKKVKKNVKRVCYLCGNKKEGISSSYSAKFSRTGINKIFTTTTINSSPYLHNYNFDNVYSMCSNCYQKLLNGEKVVSEQFKGKIAGENAFIIPEGLFNNFDYNFVYKLKQNVDLAFKRSSTEELLEYIEAAVFGDAVNFYTLNFIIYRTDGNSVTVLETIEDVPTLRFEKIIRILAANVSALKPHLKDISLGSIYSLVPVRTNKKGEQLDIGRVLSLYKAILAGEQVNSQALFNYAAEALDKGLRQLSKVKPDNYLNMGLMFYAGGKEDFFIKRIIMSYLVLFRAARQLNILGQKDCHKKGKEEKKLQKISTVSVKTNASIEEMEKFLDEQEFSNEARALFYLGVLINRVAIAQYSKEHKTKPILKKIQFQGMKDKEVYRLYQDVLEKLRQYNKFSLYTEALINRFHHYYGNLEADWPLSERENVFYIMSGYAYLVGNRAPDITAEEEKDLAESVDEPKPED